MRFAPFIAASGVLAGVLAGQIRVQVPVPLQIVYSNSPPCAVVQTSTNLVDWDCYATLSRCDGGTNFNSISFGAWGTGSNRYFRVLPCP